MTPKEAGRPSELVTTASASDSVVTAPAPEDRPAREILAAPFGAAESRRRALRLRRNLFVIAAILLPVLAAAVYVFALAHPMYTTETRFAIRGADSMQNSQSGGVTSLLSQGGGTGLSGFVDGYAVRDFILSRDAMVKLNSAIDLRKYFAQPQWWDPLTALPPNADDNQLYSVYASDVTARYNMIEQIVVVDVQSFTPQTGVTIANAVLELVDKFVDKMNDRGVQDALKVAKGQVEGAEKRAATAREAVEKWRNETGNMDPVADAVMLTSVIGQLETQLAAAQADLARVKAFDNPNHTGVRPAEIQVATLQERIADLRKRLGGGGSSEAAQLTGYQGFKAAADFAEANLTSARQTYEQALLNSLQQQRYVSVIAEPVSDSTVTFPNKPVLLIETLAAALALAFFGSIFLNAGRHLLGG